MKLISQWWWNVETPLISAAFHTQLPCFLPEQQCLCLAEWLHQSVLSWSEDGKKKKKHPTLFGPGSVWTCRLLPLSGRWQGQLSWPRSGRCWPAPAPPPPFCPSLLRRRRPAHPGSEGEEEETVFTCTQGSRPTTEIKETNPADMHRNKPGSVSPNLWLGNKKSGFSNPLFWF